MSSKTFSRGGQRRTLNAPCGWICKGTPREVSGRLAIHQRRCKQCSEADTVVPEFDTTVGVLNGWNGICGSRFNNGILSTATGDNVIDTVHIKTTSTSVAVATEQVRELIK